MNKKIILPVIALCLLFWLTGCIDQNSNENYDVLATCLTEHWVKMYGTDTCPHCLNQKRAFGDSFKKIDYVNCGTNPDACVKENIEGVPTWVLWDWTRLQWEQDLTELATKVGCEIK